MSLISLLDDSCGSIRQSLSLEQIQIAFTFLKKRFPQYSLKQIVLSLSEYIFQKQYSTVDNTQKLFQKKKNRQRRINLDYINDFQGQCSPQERHWKKDKIKLIAKLYCENGVKFTLVQYFYPNLTLKDYKHILETIMMQTLNNISTVLKYECNVLLDQIPKTSKRKIAPKLFNIKQCIGKQNSAIIQTFYKFIERFYIDQNIQIQYKDALSLFKQIEQFCKKNQEETTVNFQVGKHRQSIFVSESDCSPEEEKAIIILFKKHQNITKVSDLMCQKYGYNLKWSKHSIKHILRIIFKSSLQKLIQSVNKYDKKTDLFFSNSQQNLNILCDNQNCFQIKQKILDFYLQKSVTLHRIRQLVKSVNLFFVEQYSPKQIIFTDQSDVRIKLPQLKSQNQVQSINSKQKQQKKEQQVIDLESIHKNKVKNNLTKKRYWIEVMEIDSDSNSIESQMFYKEADTDIQSNLITEDSKKILKIQSPPEKNIEIIENLNKNLDNNFEKRQSQQQNGKVSKQKENDKVSKENDVEQIVAEKEKQWQSMSFDNQ